MTSLIYQYWKGSRPEYSYASEEAFRNYADSIKADYHLGSLGISGGLRNLSSSFMLYSF